MVGRGMRIGTKLAICFVALAVLPLGAASAVYLRATSKFGAEMAERGKDLLAERINRDLRRASELGAVSIEQTRDRVAREVRFLASEVAARLSVPENEALPDDHANGFIIESGQDVQQNTDGDRSIDLQQLSVHMAPDATRDQTAGILKQLSGLNEVARTVYLRNRGAIDAITVTFESGLTISYPGHAAQVSDDPRESDWYLGTLERAEMAWFNSPRGLPGRLSVTAPIQLDDGRLTGAVQATIRADSMLAQSLDASRLPPDAKSFLLAVPLDDPELMPHEVAFFDPENGSWKILDRPRPMSLQGDDAWLKVVSDIRTGVPGLEYVNVDGNAEVWAFGPIGSTVESRFHIAVTYPSGIIDAARGRAGEAVESSYHDQLRTAVGFTLVAGLLAAALALFGARTLTSPVRRLHEAAAKLTRGDFEARVQNPGGDEIGDLARDFNRMVPALEEQIRVKRELHAAQEIQQHLIPDAAPDIGGFDIVGKTIYCDETGGDYQDYVPLGDDHYAVVIGDVTGHGVGAALLMASARAVLRASATHTQSPADLLAAVNRQLSADSSGGRSLTLFHLHLTAGSRDFEWISAGHEPALLYNPEDDSFTLLDGEDIPLGIDLEWSFTSKAASLPEGGVLVAYTDGVREAVGDNGQQYGLEPLKSAIREHHQNSSAAVLDAVLADLGKYCGKQKAKDDVSLLVVKPV